MINKRNGQGMGIITALSLGLIIMAGADTTLGEQPNTNTSMTNPTDSQALRSARLCLEVRASKVKDKGVFINGRRIGSLPLSQGKDFNKQTIEIPAGALGAIATINSIWIENKPKDPKQPMDKDRFEIRNAFLEVVDKDGNRVESNLCDQSLKSYRTGIIDVNEKQREYLYFGVPKIAFTLTLPVDKSGYIKQPLFSEERGPAYSGGRQKVWKGLEKDRPVKADKYRTMLGMRAHEFIWHPDEYIKDILERYNAGVVYTDFVYHEPDFNGKVVNRAKWLREQGVKIQFMFGPGLLRNAYNRIPGSDAYNRFIGGIRDAAILGDAVLLDEWFLAPDMIITDGGKATELTDKFMAAFQAYAGYSPEDARWAFKNWSADDKRALKAWEFCGKIQNDLVRECVSAAKQANPRIKINISYITRNWNKLATCIDAAVEECDEILDCQTYWYGRAAEDSLNSPAVSAAVGLGKIMNAEYPDKFLWMGIEPAYVGQKDAKDKESSWQKKNYHNTVEEVTPYLATLYASSDGVFIQNSEGRQELDWGRAGKPDIGLYNGEYIDEFADVVRLVASLVPRVKNYVKSDIAYYYDPQATWETIRRGNFWVEIRRTHDVTVGLMQQFFDVDVIREIKGYRDVISAGLLLPKVFDYELQNIYLLYTPGYDETGDNISEKELAEKLGIKGFSPLGGTNYFPADDKTINENGCMDSFRIKDESHPSYSSRAHGMAINGAAVPIMEIIYDKKEEVPIMGISGDTGKSDENDEINELIIENDNIICAQNKQGNIRINSFWPSFISQSDARYFIKRDADYFGWSKRDCLQVNGVEDIVAVAFREPRTAVIDFGASAKWKHARLTAFNGREGITRDEVVPYQRGMKVDLSPLAVLVAHGME